MKKNISTPIFIIVVIILLLVVKEKFSSYNLGKAISACILAQKTTVDTFNLDEAKKFCEKEINKQSND